MTGIWPGGRNYPWGTGGSVKCTSAVPQEQLALASVVSLCICVVTLHVLDYRSFSGEPIRGWAPGEICVGSGAWSVRLWAPSGGAGAALGGAVRALSAAPLGVPGKALRLRRPGGYQARLRRPGNAVPSKTTHPLNVIDFTGGTLVGDMWTSLELPVHVMLSVCSASDTSICLLCAAFPSLLLLCARCVLGMRIGPPSFFSFPDLCEAARYMHLHSFRTAAWCVRGGPFPVRGCGVWLPDLCAGAMVGSQHGKRRRRGWCERRRHESSDLVVHASSSCDSSRT